MIKISEIEWTETYPQTSDCLTKYGASSLGLLRVLKGEKIFAPLQIKNT